MSGWDAEVLVVGGGPAGATTAALLAARGRHVLVLEKAAFPREKPCAEYLSPGAVDALERLGVLATLDAAGPARPRGMRICTERASFLVEYPDRGVSRLAMGIPRPVLDQVLLDRARQCGAAVRERVLVLAPLLETGRVVGVRAYHAAPERRDASRESAGNSAVAEQPVLGRHQEQVRARFVVAADGLHSAVARALGLQRTMRWPRRLGLVARYADTHGVDSYGEMHVGRNLYCGLAPVGGGLVNVGLVTGLNDRRSPGPIGAYFERRLREIPGAWRALRGARRITPVRGVGPLARRVQRVAGPGFLLVGDAAGFLDPFTGEGVYRALRGGELAADAVERALARQDGVPVGYARARRTAFGDKERVCLLIQAFLGSSRLFDYALDQLARRPGPAALLQSVLGDLGPAAPALRPAYLWALLRP
jgi:flavin-dependent dehydrogenase